MRISCYDSVYNILMIEAKLCSSSIIFHYVILLLFCFVVAKSLRYWYMYVVYIFSRVQWTAMLVYEPRKRQFNLFIQNLETPDPFNLCSYGVLTMPTQKEADITVIVVEVFIVKMSIELQQITTEYKLWRQSCYTVYVLTYYCTHARTAYCEMWCQMVRVVSTSKI